MVVKINKYSRNIILTIIKYGCSLYITCLAISTVHSFKYLISGFIELLLIFMISNSLIKIRKIIGYLVNVLLLFFYNIQILSLYFANSFITKVMLDNIIFLNDLQGKFYKYLMLIILIMILTFIPIEYVKIKKNTKISGIILISLIEIMSLLMQRTYSPYYNLYQLAKARYIYGNTLWTSQENGRDAKLEFYNDKIEGEIEKPTILGEKPNVIIIYVEGFSKNIVSDGRNIVPNISKIAAESLEFTNYYNHTFATLQGLIGQLYSGYQLDNMDTNSLISLQSILSTYGYSTIFINTEPENEPFTQYLSNLGFDKLITDNNLVDENTGYINDKEAFEFLYDVTEQQCKSGQPFLTSIYTYGTHVSLDSPDEVFQDGTDPLLNKFYNMDFQIGQFIQKFKENDAFNK